MQQGLFSLVSVAGLSVPAGELLVLVDVLREL